MEKKTTLKAGALALLLTAGVGSTIYAGTDDAPVTAKAVPAWNLNQSQFANPGTPTPGQIRTAGSIDLLTTFEANKDSWGEGNAFADFSNLKNNALPGIYASFIDSKDASAKIQEAQFKDVPYGEYLTVNKPVIAKVTGSDDAQSETAFGINPGQMTVAAQVEMLYSTRGLSNVNDISFKLGSEAFENVNRAYAWSELDFMVYGDKGDLELTAFQFYTNRIVTTAEGNTLIAAVTNYLNNPSSVLSRKQIANALKQSVEDETAPMAGLTFITPDRNTSKGYKFNVIIDNARSENSWHAANAQNQSVLFIMDNKEHDYQFTFDLTELNVNRKAFDNKFIRVVMGTAGDDWAIKESEGSTANQMTMTYIKDVTVNFHRPVTTIATGKDFAQLTDTATNATLFEAGAGRVDADEYYFGLDIRNWNPKEPTNLDVAANNTTSLLKLNVKYPFVLDEISGSETLVKGTDYTVVGTPGTDKVVTYYIARTKTIVVKDEENTNSYREDRLKVKYHFAPQHVTEYELDAYVDAHVIADSYTNAALKLQGNSIPEFCFEDRELNFTKFNEIQSSKISFKKLPKFTKGELADALSVILLTPADDDATTKYDDDVEFAGFSALPILEGTPWDNFPGKLENKDLDLTKYVDAKGNLLESTPLFAAIKYVRGNVNIDDPASLIVDEKFGIDPLLTYAPVIKNVYKLTDGFTGKNIRELLANNGKKYAQMYCGDIHVAGNNEWVWYELPCDTAMCSSIGDAFAVANNVKQYFDKYQGNNTVEEIRPSAIGRTDVYFSKMKITGTSTDRGSNYSRPHVIKVFATGLKPDVPDGKIATLKVYREADAEGGLDRSASFYFGSDSKLAYWDAAFTQPASADRDKLQGAASSVLYYKIDLTNQALIRQLKNEGLPLTVQYFPHQEEIFMPSAAYFQRHAAQFAISTKTEKAYNEFYTVGITDRAVATNVWADKLTGTYNNFSKDLLEAFDRETNCPTMTTGQGIFRDQFKKYMGTSYVGQTCYTTEDSYFWVAGLNLVDDVNLNLNKAGMNAFKYSIVTAFGSVKGKTANDEGIYEVAGNQVLVPNEYGELLVLVKVSFAPTAADKAKSVPHVWDIWVNNNDKRSHKENLLGDEIHIIPVQNQTQLITPVVGFDARNYSYNFGTNVANYPSLGLDLNMIFNEIGEIYDGVDKESWLFSQYGFFATKNLAIPVLGDVKVPSLKVVESADFGVINIGDKTEKTFTIEATDMAHYNAAGEEIKKIYLENGNNMYTLSTKSFDNYECDMANDTLGDKYTVEFKIKASPLAQHACNRDDVVKVYSMCNEGECAKTINLTYTAALAPAKNVVTDAIDGGRAELKWDAVPGALYYTVEVGDSVATYTSENVFISEVYAVEDGNIKVELFNGTGEDINPNIVKNYLLALNRDVNGANDKDFVMQTIELNGEVWPAYSCRVFEFANKAIVLNNKYKYTVTLHEFRATKDNQIDIYQFEGPATHLMRVAVDGLKINKGDFKIADWETLNPSLPTSASYAWGFQFKPAKGGDSCPQLGTPQVSIQGMLAKKNYLALIKAFNDECEVISSVYVEGLPTSLNNGAADENIQFNQWFVGNEDVELNAVKVIPGKGAVRITGAAGKKVVINNILGKGVAEAAITSDDVTIAVPATGVILIAIDGEETVKAVMK